MKKKIIISVLLIACLLTLSVLTIPKVSAHTEETDDNFYSVSSEIMIYEDSVLDSLLSLTSDGTSKIRFNYRLNTYSTLWSEDSTLPPLVLDVSIDRFVLDTYYFYVPDFDHGYYLDFRGVTLKYSYLFNDTYYKNYYLDIPFKPHYYDWYYGDDTLIEGLLLFSGFDKININMGLRPSFSGSQVETINECALYIWPLITLEERGGNVFLRFEFEYVYGSDSDIIYCLIPISDILPPTNDYLPYVDAVASTTEDTIPPIYTPMSYFTFKKYEYSTEYDNGYSEGYDKGKRDGYALGQTSLDIDFTSWISTAVGGFLSFEFVPGLSLFAVLSFIISLGLLFLILRFFSGG